MTALFDHFLALDRALVAKGFPPTSPWWRGVLAEFYGTSCRQLVLRVGRRGGKSSTLCRIAVVEALFGSHDIPPGDVGIVGFVSVNRDEAAQRLRTIRSILDALGVKHRPTPEGGVEVIGRRVVFRTFAATVGAVVGGTLICALCDEVSRWRDSDTGANPATDVLASLRPTLATMPNARIFLSSSPLGTRDAHAKAFDEGSTDFQQVAFAATWTANPSVTEEETRRLEPDPRLRAREFGGQPQGDVLSAFDADTLADGFRDAPYTAPLGQPIALLDSSAGRGDSWTWATAQWFAPFVEDAHDAFMWRAHDDPDADTRSPIVFYRGTPSRMCLDASGTPIPSPTFARTHRPTIHVANIGALDGAFRGSVTADDAVARVARVARDAGATDIFGDTYQAFFLEGELSQKHSLTYRALRWTNESKGQAVLTLRRWFRDRSISIEPGPEAERLRAELLAFEEKVTPTGSLTYGARRGGHDDRVALLLNLAMTENVGSLDGSPHARSSFRFEIDGS